MGGQQDRWSVSRGNCRQQSVRPQRDRKRREMRQTKAGRIQRRQPFLLPLPSLFLSCNTTPEEPWQADTQNQFQTCPTPLLLPPSLPDFASLCVFWYHLTLDSVASDELTMGSDFSALLECEGSKQSGRGAGEVKGYWASVEEQRREGCLSSGGVPVGGYLRGLECWEQNRSYRGQGLRMSWGQATFDSTQRWRLDSIYTLKYTHNTLQQENVS